MSFPAKNGTAWLADGLRINALHGGMQIEISDMIPMDQCVTLQHAHGALTFYCGRLAYIDIIANIALHEVLSNIRRAFNGDGGENAR